MITDPESSVQELRSQPAVKHVDIPQFPSGKELWIVLRDPINLEKLEKASQSLGYAVVKVGSLPSKLPRSLAELIWDGVTYVVTKNQQPWWKPKFGPDSSSVAKIVRDLATGDTVYRADDDAGLKVLQDYLRN